MGARECLDLKWRLVMTAPVEALCRPSGAHDLVWPFADQGLTPLISLLWGSCSMDRPIVGRQQTGTLRVPLVRGPHVPSPSEGLSQTVPTSERTAEGSIGSCPKEDRYKGNPPFRHPHYRWRGYDALVHGFGRV